MSVRSFSVKSGIFELAADCGALHANETTMPNSSATSSNIAIFHARDIRPSFSHLQTGLPRVWQFVLHAHGQGLSSAATGMDGGLYMKTHEDTWKSTFSSLEREHEDLESLFDMH